MEDEISEKDKYAKYHSVRIIKALKEGIDPNIAIEDEMSVLSLENENKDEDGQKNATGEDIAATQEGNTKQDQEMEEESSFNLNNNHEIKDDSPTPPKKETHDALPVQLPPSSSPPTHAPIDAKISAPVIESRIPDKRREPTASRREISSDEIARIQKHAKWAISALNYEDLATARKEFLMALEILRPFE